MSTECKIICLVSGRYGGDIKKERKKKEKRGIEVEEKRLYSTIYRRCDAAGERGKRDETVDKVRRYLEKKKLEISLEKTKIMKFEREKTRRDIWK